MRLPPIATRIHCESVDALLLLVAHEAAPSCHAAEGPLDDPAAGQHLETLLAVGPTDDLDPEVEIGGFVYELLPVIGAIGEQMLDQWPSMRKSSRTPKRRYCRKYRRCELTINSRPSVPHRRPCVAACG